ncbi:hypothetical protein CP556_19120 [Natrinema sp. CBA1119]|uniref:DUF7115 domain-containing protein n=1 Tax=Natrinema sp. CBA1119 TaxID=1608465 RepID=UPI000BF32A0A|nr:hypothetical protein [Natrinema sp. CBA1119]PGF18001.1 hypothetical protein CP556_19120 [Natrinema sp. CBA1119]
MSVPGIVNSTLDDEEIAARVSLGSDDELFITPTRTIVYRADGLLSDESADEYPHDADRLTLSEGRRKTKVTLEYALDGERTFSIPSSVTDDVLHPVLAGVLNGNGITDPGETVVKTYRFSELTLIITSDRLVKHIGGAVWDGDFEEYHFEDVTQLAFEDGSVATQIVLTVDGRPQRIKAPNEQANDLRERLQRALFDYHDVGSLEELNEAVGRDDEDDTSRGGSVDFGGGVDPLDADPPEPDDHDATVEAARDAAGSGSTDPLAGGETDDITTAEPGRQSNESDGGQSTSNQASATADRDRDGPVGTTETASLFDAGDDIDASASAADPAEHTDVNTPEATAGTDPELLERLDALEVAVERQSEIIEKQGETIEQLIAELRQGR